jgi:hypothetical protein
VHRVPRREIIRIRVGPIAVNLKGLCQEPTGITCKAKSGTSPIDVTRRNFYFGLLGSSALGGMVADGQEAFWVVYGKNIDGS